MREREFNHINYTFSAFIQENGKTTKLQGLTL